MKISVLGSGCATCKKLYETVLAVVKKENIDAEVDYSDDISRIAELGLMYSPVLVVDGKPIELRTRSEKEVKEVLYNKITQDDGCCAESDSCGCNC